MDVLLKKNAHYGMTNTTLTLEQFPSEAVLVNTRHFNAKTGEHFDANVQLDCDELFSLQKKFLKNSNIEKNLGVNIGDVYTNAEGDIIEVIDVIYSHQNKKFMAMVDCYDKLKNRIVKFIPVALLEHTWNKKPFLL